MPTNSDMVNKYLLSIKKRITSYVGRRPHRSFRRTRRRDYRRELNLPGYWSFTSYVNKVLWNHRKTFGLLAITYAILTVVLVGIASQETYSSLAGMLDSSGGDFFSGNWGNIEKAGLLMLSAITGGLSSTLTESQQIYAMFISLLVWLTAIWLLRNILAGHKVKLRDGLYNAGSPIMATSIVALLMLVQMLPLVIALVGYGAADETGLLAAGGVESMLFWIAAVLLIVLTVYLVTSTFFALVIVSLPGMYPYRAIKMAGDLVIGRRLRILMRFLWMSLIIVLAWILIMLPVILFDMWLKSVWSGVDWLPLIPITLLVMGSLTIVWTSSYVYLLYRKVVDDNDIQP